MILYHGFYTLFSGILSYLAAGAGDDGKDGVKTFVRSLWIPDCRIVANAGGAQRHRDIDFPFNALNLIFQIGTIQEISANGVVRDGHGETLAFLHVAGAVGLF